MSNIPNVVAASTADAAEFSYLQDGSGSSSLFDAFVRADPEGSPYHLGAWRAAVAEAYGHVGKVLIARQGGEIAGGLPLCMVARPFGKTRWSALPFCDLGGPLARTSALADALAARAAHDAADAGAAGFEARRSAGPRDESALEGRKVRMLLTLPDSADALMKSYAPKLRSQIRKAEKNGLACAVETGPAAVAAFYEVYSRNMRRLGSPAHSLRWFEAIQRHYGQEMFIMVVRHEGQAVGAGLVLLCGDKAAIPWASTLAEFNALAPNMLLYWAIQAHLCELGVHQFDFGRSTFGEGTYRFKKQWGALPHLLDWQEWDGGGARRAPAAASSGGGRLRPLIERTWSKLPLGVANTVGPRLRRYITL